MPLPEALRKQVKEAEKKRKDFVDGLPDGEKAPPVTTIEDAPIVTENETPPAEPPAEPPADQATPPAEENVAAADRDTATEPAKEEKTKEKEKDAEYWKHKYDVLNGKYKKEVPTLHQQLHNVESVLANMQVPAEVERGPSETVLTQAEIEDYGADMVNVMKKAAREEMSPYINKLEQENAQLRSMLGNVSQTAQTSARDVMLSTLDSEVPGWQEQNTSEGFLAWLQQPDVYSGVSRQQMLTEAFEQNHTARVVAFFKGYRSENAVTGAHDTPAAQEQDPTPPQPQVHMDTLVAPGTPSQGANTGAQSEKRYFTQAEIQAFYSDIRQGKFAKNPKLREKIEAEIFSAVNEGRIQV